MSFCVFGDVKKRVALQDGDCKLP